MLERLLDANANRAREAVRLLEDIARFQLADTDLAERAKRLRHGLAEAMAAFDSLSLLASRDTAGDVGTAISTRREFERAGLPDLAAAAGKRLSEALRVLEEAAKVDHPAAARAIERLRYLGYDIERDVTLALGTGRARQWRLCVLLSEGLCPDGDWLGVAGAAIAGGADCLQLREKSLDDVKLLDRARRLVELARPLGVSVVINDRVDIALASEADGVHLGQNDLPIPEARRLAGGSLLIGVSTATMEQARMAAEAGADCCGCGPMFASTTKAKPNLVGTDYLRAYLADPMTSRVPHLAISGIDANRARELAAIGCRGVAVSSAVCAASDPEAAAREIVSALDAAAGRDA